MFKKYFFPEYNIRYISHESLKFGDIEIEKRKLHPSKKLIDVDKKRSVPDVHLPIANIKKHSLGQYASSLHKWMDITMPKGTKSISFEIKDKVLQKKYISRLGIRSTAL